jgi:Rap1a immunity proteins
MDGILGGNPPFLRLIRIGLFGLVLIGSHAAASSLSSEAANHDQLVPGPTRPSSRSTLSLYHLCGSSSAGEVSWCEGYLMGLADILLAMGNSQMPGGICGADYDTAALSKVFSFWAKRHPERWNDDMAVSAQASFRELWPCPSQ